jgi:TonB family protein
VTQQGTGPQGTVGAEPTLAETDVAGPHGTVAVYVLIDQNGTPQDLHVSLSADKVLDRISVEAIRKWHYAPATCTGTPVAAEEVAVIEY